MTCLSQGSMNIFPSVSLLPQHLAREARKTKAKIDGSFNYKLVF